MTQVTANDARKQFADILNRAAYAHEPTVITRQGKEIAAVISIEDLAYYQQLEDLLDGEMAKERLAQGNRRYSLEEAKAKLGLK